MHPEKKEPPARSNTLQPVSERTPSRREWQPPKGEIVEVASATRSGVLGGIDGVSCHS